MMGYGHAVTGAAMWGGACLLAIPLLDTATLAPAVASAPLAAVVLLGAAPVTGASLIPDVDHPNGTIAHSMGMTTKVLTRIVAFVSGGHRQATHGIWFWAVMTLFAFSMHFAAVNAPTVSADANPVQVALAWATARADLITFFMLTAFGQRALGAKWLKRLMSRVWRSSTSAMVRVVFFLEAAILTVVAALVFPEPSQWIWLPFAVSIGHLSHLIADSLTTAGVMWAWPSEKLTRLPIIGNAGSVRERFWSGAMSVLFAAALAVSVTA